MATDLTGPNLNIVPLENPTRKYPIRADLLSFASMLREIADKIESGDSDIQSGAVTLYHADIKEVFTDWCMLPGAGYPEAIYALEIIKAQIMAEVMALRSNQ